MPAGPSSRFFREVAKLQQKEQAKKETDRSYEPRVRIAIVTARNAFAHERVVTTLREWGIEVDELFFLGYIEKARIFGDSEWDVRRWHQLASTFDVAHLIVEEDVWNKSPGPPPTLIPPA
jgi:5'-nucleotidase